MNRALPQKGFEDLTPMFDVRTKYINPTIDHLKNVVDPKITKIDPLEKDVTDLKPKVTKLESDVSAIAPKLETSLSNKVTVLPVTKQIIFEENDGTGVPVDLTQMFDHDSHGITIGKYDLVTDMQFDGATVTQNNQTKQVTVTVDKIPGKVGSKTEGITSVELTGNVGSSSIGNDGKLTINLPTGGGSGGGGSITGDVGDGNVQDVTKIVLAGQRGGSTLENNTLTIDLPAGGGTLGSQYFAGFFDTLQALIDAVTHPVVNKSYGYVRHNVDGMVYEVPYWYAAVTGSATGEWKVLTTSPSITYEEGGTTKQIKSIKTNPHITVDNKGQADFNFQGGTSDPQYFHGLFESSDEMKAEIKNPTVGKSLAYAKVSGTSVMLGYQYVAGAAGGPNEWKPMAPFSAIGLLEGAGTSAKAAPIYGIKKNGMTFLDHNNNLVIKDVSEETVTIEYPSVTDPTQTAETKINTIKFLDDNTSFSIEDKKLTIKKLQQVVAYDSTFEETHKSAAYNGSIYYDTNTQTWIGNDTPPGTDPQGPHWTRIAHRGMSSEVKSLTKRMPPRIDEVSPGVTGDTPRWENSSWTYLEKDNEQLPTLIKEKMGAYILTQVKDVAGEAGSIRPQTRTQICYSDEDECQMFVRRWKKNQDIADPQWTKWVKVSYDKEALSHHEQDPAAHKDVIKFYRVATFNLDYQALVSNSYTIPREGFRLLADNYGHAHREEQKGFKFPYDGKFKLNGCISINAEFSKSASQFPKGDWIFSIHKQTEPGKSELIKEFKKAGELGTGAHSKNMKPMKWYLNPTEFKKDDVIFFMLKYTNDSSFNQESSFTGGVRFHAFRSYLVVEDEHTDTGGMMAESYRELLGPLNAWDKGGVNVHPGGGTSTRVYGERINDRYENMA